MRLRALPGVMVLAIAALAPAAGFAQFNQATIISTSAGGIVSGTYGYFKYVSASSISGVSADRITSGTTSMVAQSGGLISITTGGVNTGYFNSNGVLVVPGISATANLTSVTSLYASSNIGIGTYLTSSTLSIATMNNIATGSNFSLGVGGLLIRSGGQGLLMDANQIEQMNVSDSLYLNYNSPASTIINYGGGNVGIGTPAPAAALDISASNVAWAGQLRLQAPDYTQITFYNSSAPTPSNANRKGGIYYDMAANKMYVVNYNGGSYGPLVLNPSGGNVGIGTTTPTTMLDVNGTGRFYTTANNTPAVYASVSGNSSGVYAEASHASGVAITGAHTTNNSYGALGLLYTGVYGVVGVATANAGGVGGQFNGGSYGVQGYGGSFGVYGSAASYGVYGYSTNNYGVYGASSNGYGLTGSSSSNIGVRGDGPGSWGGYFTGQSGVLGASTNGVGVRGESTNQQGVFGYSANNWAGYFTGGNYGVYGTGSQYAGYFDGQVWVSNRLSTPTVCLSGDCRSAWPTPTAGYDDSVLRGDYNWWHQTVSCGPWGSIALRDCVWSVTNNYANWFYGWFFTAGMGSSTWYNPWGNIGVWTWINNSITNMANCGYSGMVWTGSACRAVDDYATWFRDWFFYSGMTPNWTNPWGNTGVWTWISGSINSIDSCGASGMVWTGSACRGAASRFGGSYVYNNGGYCYRGNPQTGGCSCPSGYGAYFSTSGFNHLDLYTCEN